MLHVAPVATTATTVLAGKAVKASIHVYAAPSATGTVLKLATSKKTTISPTCNRITGGCNLQTVDADGIFVPVTITVPKGTAAGGITLTATASATGATTVKKTMGITVAKATSTTHHTTHNSTDSGGSGTNTGGSGGTGSTGGSAANNSTTSIPGSGSAYVPPGAAGALAPPTNGTPSAQFPQIAPQAGSGGATPPALAGGQAQNMGALRAASPEPQELTFQRLASTQAAWLAALLVAFSLLLTHIRLNKPADARRRKGVHRRQRAGVFQA